MTKLRIYQLDLFRFLAATMVVLYHYLFVGPQIAHYPLVPEVANVARYGYLGVEWFFMISGFVIVMSAGGQTWSSFMRGRFSRLFPLFWVCCTLTFVGTHLLSAPPRITFDTTTYLSNMGMVLPHAFRTEWIDGSYWTLTYEWAFYIGIAVLLRLDHFERFLSRYLLAWLGVSMAVLLSVSPATGVFHEGLRLATLADYAPYFVAGVSFYRLHRRRATRLDVYNLLFSYLLAVKSATLHAEEMFVKFHNDLSPGVVQCVVTILFVIFVLFSIGKLESLNRKVFLRFGVLTYSVYLIHQFLGYALLARLVPVLGLGASLVATGVAAVTAGAVLHYLVEKPFHRLLKPKS